MILLSSHFPKKYILRVYNTSQSNQTMCLLVWPPLRQPFWSFGNYGECTVPGNQSTVPVSMIPERPSKIHFLYLAIKFSGSELSGYGCSSSTKTYYLVRYRLQFSNISQRSFWNINSPSPAYLNGRRQSRFGTYYSHLKSPIKLIILAKWVCRRSKIVTSSTLFSDSLSLGKLQFFCES